MREGGRRIVYYIEINRFTTLNRCMDEDTKIYTKKSIAAGRTVFTECIYGISVTTTNTLFYELLVYIKVIQYIMCTLSKGTLPIYNAEF